MKKIFLCVFSIVLTFSLSAAANAKTIAIDFEDMESGTSLSGQYSSEGIYFSDSTGTSASGIITEFESSMRLQSNTDDNTIYIMFDDPIHFFSCDKWEPADENQYGGQRTVYWNFYDDSMQILGSTFNDVKNSWQTVTFTSTESIYVVEIMGNIYNNGSYYLDNFQLKTEVSTIPEPSSIFLFCLGMIGIMGFRKKTRK